MADNSELIPIDICIAIEHGKEKIKKEIEIDSNFPTSIQDIIENNNKRYIKIVLEHVPDLLRPYVLTNEIKWPFSFVPENMLPSQFIYVKIDGLPEFSMIWIPSNKWAAYLPEKTFCGFSINYDINIEIDDIEIFMAELYETIITQEQNSQQFHSRQQHDDGDNNFYNMYDISRKYQPSKNAENNLFRKEENQNDR